jgi:hypothetical protein
MNRVWKNGRQKASAAATPMADRQEQRFLFTTFGFRGYSVNVKPRRPGHAKNKIVFCLQWLFCWFRLAA